jgi:hypothetical protein
MNALKAICLTIIQTIKQAWFFPQAMAHALKQRRRPILLDAHEIERLDRLRNPSKYLGK